MGRFSRGRAVSCGWMRPLPRSSAAIRRATRDASSRATAGRVLRRLGALEPGPGDGEPLRPPAPEQGPRVSVVIATHDGRELLAACLRSLGEQRYAPLEIVVVDGGLDRRHA